MRRTICLMGMCLALTFTGCSSTANWTKLKGMTAFKSRSSSPSRGSADVSLSSKLKDPIKVQLAYAAWHEQKSNFVEARSAYLKVLDKKPKELEALLGLARIEQMYERDEECDQALERALKHHPKDPRVFVAMGQIYATRGDLDEALDKMHTAQKLAPLEPIYEYHLAVIEARAGEIELAMEHFKRSVGQAEAHNNVGIILNEQGKTAEAEMHLAKAVQLKPELKQASTALAEIRSAKHAEVQPASFQGGTARQTER